LYKCTPDNAVLTCGEISKSSGAGLSKSYPTQSAPTITYAPNVENLGEPTLYVIWSSDVNMHDSSSTKNFMYYRRLNSPTQAGYYGDYSRGDAKRPKTFETERKGSLHTYQQIAALEHNNTLEILRLPSGSRQVERFRYELLDMDAGTVLSRVSTLPIKSKSAVTAASLDGKLYVVYQNADGEDEQVVNSLNCLIIDDE
jgi:hypothetical protein